MIKNTLPVVVDTTNSPFAKLRPMPVNAVQLNDSFWAPRLAINREATIPSQFQQIEDTNRLNNLRRASGKIEADFEGIFFNDSDIYKWLEAASFAIVHEDDPETRRMIEVATREIADAQQEDGYLNTYFMFEKAKDRWTNLKDMHELYCAGHFFQAAVAHYRATGEEAMLDVARRFADLICETFGEEADGKKVGACGHEEVEMGLVELYRATGERKYLDQANYFLGVRGRKPPVLGGGEYHQDHLPVREQDRMTGHAVRHVYLTSGIADVYLETGEPALLNALEPLWRNMTERQMYVTGGIGSRYEGEAFGNDYELPNERAYTETCAAIGSLMWNWRMLAATAEARFADVMELALYNGILSGLSLDGKEYFYQNPLADSGAHRRQAWFGCACCPPNVARLLAELPGYFYSVSENTAWVHLFAEGSARLTLPDGREIELAQHTRYPWDGMVEIEVRTAGEFEMAIRVPGWAEGASASLAGPDPIVPGSYLRLRRTWQDGDKIALTLPMPVRRVYAHPHVAENQGHVALMRGPLVYCVEQADNPGIDPRDLVLPRAGAIEPHFEPDRLNGVIVLTGRALARPPASEWSGRLYAENETPIAPEAKPVTFTAIPYYAWANRAPGRMQVWLKEED